MTHDADRTSASPGTRSGSGDLDAVAATATAAQHTWSLLDPGTRAGALVAAADALAAAGDELIGLGVAETGLPVARLTGELNRTAVQLRLFADVVRAGEYLDVRIDEADPEFAIGPRPALRRVRWPIGPVLVFAAGNFPLAFSVAGGDTASALAAGCSVVVKAHPGHPELSRRTAALVSDTLTAAGAPAGLLQLVEGQQTGVDLLRHPAIRAAAFTGSTRGGVALARIAAERPDPIPFYGELGSVNPVHVTAGAATARSGALVTGYLTSVSGSAGQLCTKPGFLLVPTGAADGLAQQVAEAAAEQAEQRLLSAPIGEAYRARRDAVLAAPGVRVVAPGAVRVDDDGQTFATPTIVAVDDRDLVAAGDDLLDESFGPLSVIVALSPDADPAALQRELFPGNLTTTVHLTEDEAGSPAVAALVEAAAATSGRVLFDGWPTGVAVTPAMQHGGPFPATTVDATSVGTAAIDRFLRGISFQSAPDALLPPPLRSDDPWRVPARRSAAGESTGWGR